MPSSSRTQQQLPLRPQPVIRRPYRSEWEDIQECRPPQLELLSWPAWEDLEGFPRHPTVPDPAVRLTLCRS